ncbi:glycine betaine/L-proline transporter ProP [Streptomyces sp. NBC_01387]|uniref:glycine betaine/L-proline transporter ProP n=1 Tax=Streptomyces sp. NBC_01500 TaxID=2903886 RepID=UPI0020252F54|nr:MULTISPECIES: glycine betaine/L-proline transporter ProP [unclassified Streptomyces]MCX4552885.1 glycine betaine/L-proline transporter ProP [Streptomyces sp. NBC_01500]WSC24865.1 glycine betaine/L-proline transporter ProP [Streptomyces sp. NBC_01766]WSV58850.1 glycine betaine/L-proline transporter ProP [Streptomyces sp. NBC_01014]
MLRILLRRRKRSLSAGDVTVTDKPEVRRAVSASALGNMMEWFDFGVYAYLAGILGEVFFPSSSPGTQVVSTFATFAAAFLVRPLGGLVFGPLGDRIGRKRVLAATMIMMAISTFAVAFLPSYDSIGFTAPILLLVCRLVQGFSTGGEYAGATTYIAEYSPDKRRGFLGSWLDFGTFVGYSLGSGIVTVLTAALGHDGMVHWGWRLPFLIAGPLGLIGLYMRLRLEETPAFKQQAEENAAQYAREPHPEGDEDPVEVARQSGKGRLKEIFTQHWQAVLVCMGLVLLYNVTNYMVTSYLPTFMTETLGQDALTAQLLVLGTMIVVVLTITTVGRTSDRWGRRPVFMAGSIALIVLAFPAMLLIREGGILLPAFGCLILGLLLVCFAGTSASTLPALFPTRLRYGALSISFNVSVSLFGGTTPLVASALVEATGNDMVPAYYLMVAGVVGLVSTYFLHETAGKPLLGSGPMVESVDQARSLVAASRTEAGRRARDVWIHLRHPWARHNGTKHE